MKIVIICEHFSKGMGYIENKLPEALAGLGMEVHLITTKRRANAMVPGLEPKWATDCPEAVLYAPPIQENGVLIHCLPWRTLLWRPRILMLRDKIRQISPSIVQTHCMTGWIALDSARNQRPAGYHLFSGAHITMSAWTAMRPRLGPSWRGLKLKVNMLLDRSFSIYSCRRVEKCYAATTDCGTVAERYFGVPHGKIEICPLGVDTDLFHVPSNTVEVQDALALRDKLGFDRQEIVCIYTGKFISVKNPLLLAQAIERLRERGLPFRGLFVGDGEQKGAISACAGSLTAPFQPHNDLGRYYRCADIAVWPTQESMSMLDAAACGKPIVVNDTVQATERFEGNGIVYKLNDLEDLVAKLATLHSAETRLRLGSYGAEKIAGTFSWRAIASRRLRDYGRAVSRGRGSVIENHSS